LAGTGGIPVAGRVRETLMLDDCPKCGLANPPGTRYCDCGYDFETGVVDRSRVPRSSPRFISSPYYFVICATCILAGIALCGFGVGGPHLEGSAFLSVAGFLIGSLGVFLLVMGAIGRKP
jgi:hypothetical protein